MSEPIVVGTFHLNKPVTYTEHYECAAWYQEHLVAPGDYEITATWHSGSWTFGVTLPGVKGRSDFGTRLGGVPVGITGYNEGVGEASVYRLHLGRDYDFAARLLREAMHQHDSQREHHITVDPTVLEFSVRTLVTEHRIGLGRDPEAKYGDVVAQVPSWSVHASVVVMVPSRI